MFLRIQARRSLLLPAHRRNQQQALPTPLASTTVFPAPAVRLLAFSEALNSIPGFYFQSNFFSLFSCRLASRKCHQSSRGANHNPISQALIRNKSWELLATTPPSVTMGHLPCGQQLLILRIADAIAGSAPSPGLLQTYGSRPPSSHRCAPSASWQSPGCCQEFHQCPCSSCL